MNCIYKKILFKFENLYAYINSFFKEKGIILMYHHISDEVIDTDPLCVCKIERFKSIIMNLKNKYAFIPINSMYDYDMKKPFAILTFDDGCMDFYNNAYPFLHDNNIPFVVYVTNNFLDKPSYIGENELIRLSQDPLVTIGYHTISHPWLRYSKELKREMWDGKSEIETIINKKIDNFAYPYGKIMAIGLRSICLAKTLDYKNSVCTISTYISSFSSKFQFFLPRIVIN